MKKYHSLKLNLFCILLASYSVFCQQSEYLVITYEVDRNKDNHPSKTYYWITPVDSLKGDNYLKKYPLYFDVFSKDDLKDCFESKDIVLFTLVSNEDFNLEEETKSEVKKLKRIISSHRKRVERIVKKWDDGYKEKMTVYVTPIKGDFCFSNLSGSDKKMIDYNGLIYLPIKNFSYNDYFFKSPKYKEVKYVNYINDDYINTL